MKVLACEPTVWYLLEENGTLFLDGIYNHSAYMYEFMIELNAAEIAQYRRRGHNYLQSLSNAIQSSAPVVIGSTSRFRGRDVSGLHRESSMRAILEWNAQHP